MSSARHTLRHGRKATHLRTTRQVLALAGCTAGLLIAVPAAQAQTAEEPAPAIDSPIQVDTGQVLAETVHPESTAAGEATCSAPALFNPLTGFKDRRDYFIAPAGDLQGTRPPGRGVP